MLSAGEVVTKGRGSGRGGRVPGAVLPRLTEADTALHNGNPDLRRAL